MKVTILVTVAACAVWLWGISGCSSSSSRSAAAAGISGKVTYKGRPLNGGDIAFHPQKGIPFSCKINADGSFSCALPDMTRGEVIVTVQTVQTGKGGRSSAEGDAAREKMLEEMRKRTGSKSSGPPVSVPEKYAQKDTSPLRWTLAEGANTKDFDLTD